MRKILFGALLCLTFFHIKLKAQKACYEFTFDMIADNREYFNVYAIPQTILGSRADIQGGFELDSVQSVFVGLNHMIEFGHPLNGIMPVMDMYYHYEDKHYNVFLGSFPRKNLLFYPLAMLTDSVDYYRPNIQGGIGQYRWEWGHQSIWIDWTSRQTETVRETFMTGITGKVQLGMFYIEDHLHYWHRAGMANDSVKDLRDNSTEGIFLGVDLKKLINVDSLTFSTGVVNTLDRIRGNDIKSSTGSLSRLVFRYNEKFGLDLTYYIGDAPSLEYGDKIYTSKNYLRTDFVWMPFRSEFVRSKVDFGVHYVDGEIDYSYQVFVTVQVNNKSH